MNADEARDLFSAAYDEALSDEEKPAFEAVLAADAAVAEEYRAFVAMLDEAHRLGDDDPADTPDLTVAVQSKLRLRSRGRFYRDRFASQGRGGMLMPFVLSIAVLAIVAAAWVLLGYASVGIGP